MAKQRNSLRAGIFMLVSLALVIFVIIAISGSARFTQTFHTYVIRFNLQDDIGGLRVGDDVRVGGLKVGSVRDIDIRQVSNSDATSRPSTEAILVYVEIPEKYPVFKDAQVGVQKGITGAAAINFDDLGSGARLSANDYLPGQPDAFSAFTHKLGAIAPDLKETVANLKIASVKVNTDLDKFAQTADSFTETGHEATATVKDVHGKIPGITDKYHSIADAAIHMLNTVTDLLGPSTRDFHGTVANLNSVTGAMKDKLPGMLDQVHKILDGVQGAVTHAGSAIEDVQKTVGNTKDITESLRGVITGNRSKLDAIIGSLKTTSDNLKYASSEIRHSPWRLLYQPKPEEVANMNLYDSMRQFAEGASSLDDAASALRDATKDKNADPEQVKKRIQQLDDSFTHFQEVEQKLWKDVKE